jgi:hypothetical protein
MFGLCRLEDIKPKPTSLCRVSLRIHPSADDTLQVSPGKDMFGLCMLEDLKQKLAILCRVKLILHA